jgi:hypothetical protein
VAGSGARTPQGVISLAGSSIGAYDANGLSSDEGRCVEYLNLYVAEKIMVELFSFRTSWNIVNLVGSECTYHSTRPMERGTNRLCAPGLSKITFQYFGTRRVL